MVISISAPDKSIIVVFSILSNDQAGFARCHFSQDISLFFCLTEGFWSGCYWNYFPDTVFLFSSDMVFRFAVPNTGNAHKMLSPGLFLIIFDCLVQILVNFSI